MSEKAFNPTVAARTRTAEQILTTPDLLEKFKEADGLAGLLADRSSVKGEGKSATKSTHSAVARRRRIRGGTYRILAAVGRKDERVRTLLMDARR